MVHFLKKLRASHIKNVLLVSLLLLFLGVVAIASRVTSQRATLDSRAAENNTFKIMTFNVIGEPLCKPRDIEEDMKKLAQFIKTNSINVVALQEVIRYEKDDCDFALQDLFKDEFKGSAYTVNEHRYFGSNDLVGYRLFLHTFRLIPPIVMQAIDGINDGKINKRGAEAFVLDTPVGKIRFIHFHPGPGQEALTSDTMLIPFINQFKNDGIPMIIIGDFNLRYDLNDAAPILKKIEEAGFYRACSPVLFPNGSCNDTAKGPSNYAIDHILIDKRATFSVKNAYVEQSLQFSDHLPVIVELIKTPPSPTPSVCKIVLFGDLSCDGVVSALDVACWTYQFRNGRSQTNCRDGNLNNDNEMDILDYTILKLQIGK